MVDKKEQEQLFKSSQIEKHYLNNYNRLVKMVLFRAGSIWDAEDVVQSAYERSMRYYKVFPEAEFDLWFGRLLNNVLRDHKSAERDWLRGFGQVEDEDETHGSCPHYPEAILREVFDLISTKSEIQIEVLSYYMKHELSAKDISEITDYPYKRTHQIIQRFKNELKELYGDT